MGDGSIPLVATPPATAWMMTSGFKLFATDTNDNVTAYCFDLNGVLSSTENLSNAQVAALETQQIIDINNDGTVGVTVLDELFNRYSDASGGMANSSEDNRYLYNTSNGLLISKLALGSERNRWFWFLHG